MPCNRQAAPESSPTLQAAQKQSARDSTKPLTTSGQVTPWSSGGWTGSDDPSTTSSRRSPALTTGTSASRVSPRTSIPPPQAENSSSTSSEHWPSLRGISYERERKPALQLPEQEVEKAVGQNHSSRKKRRWQRRYIRIKTTQ